MNTKSILCLPLVTLLAIPATRAHHGSVNNPGLYLADEMVEIEGEVTDVLWRNPHVRFRLNVTGENGEDVIWEAEMGPGPTEFRRRGIPQDFIRPGDTVRVAGNVSRRNPETIGLIHLLLPDGREFVGSRNAENRWSNEPAVSIAFRIPGPADADPALVEAAREAAVGIFRVWGGSMHPPHSDYVPLLTDRGREVAATYVQVRDDPELECRTGMPTTMFDPTAMQIVDQDDRILIRIRELDVERTVHMAAGADDAAPQGSPLGHSVGRWEDDALVVTTTGVDWPYFDPEGTPQSGQVQFTERFSLADGGNTLDYSLTVVDPEMFSEPFTLSRPRQWAPGLAMEPFDCLPEWED